MNTDGLQSINEEGGAHGVDEEAGHDGVPLADVFVTLIGAPVDLLEIAWSPTVGFTR